jgi:photosystem II stability/assembly factor-like uncharacterized protein
MSMNPSSAYCRILKSLSCPGFRPASVALAAALFALSAGSAFAQENADSGKKLPPSVTNPARNLRPLPHDENDREALQEGPEFLKRRLDWFFKPRAFPLGFIPQGARERALQHMKQMYQREGRFSLRSAAISTALLPPPSGSNAAWTPIGPQATTSQFYGGFTSGRVTALAVNPNNTNNVYLGGADGGLWMTTDGGTTWTPLTDYPPNSGIPTIAVGALALDPSTCGSAICTTVFVGTGEDNFAGDNIYGEGVLKCTVTSGAPPSAACIQDNTFHFSNGKPLDQMRGGPLVGALAVDRASGKNNILLAAVRGRGTAIESGIYCSENSGLDWVHVLPDVAGVVGTDVAFASDGTAWAALGSPSGNAVYNGIYKSKVALAHCSDITGSAAWNQSSLPAGTPASKLGRITLAIAPSDNTRIYAAIADSTTFSTSLLGVITTTNATSASPAWTQLTAALVTTSGICNHQCFFDLPLAVHPADPKTVYAGGAAQNGTLIRSTDGGNTWAEISRSTFSDGLHVDMHVIAFDKTGGTMYVGNDGGAWKTTTPKGAPNAGFWTNLNQSLNITQFYPGVSIHPSSTGFALGGTQDNGTQVYQGWNGSPLLWQDAGFGCDGGFTAIDFSIPSTSYGECEYIPSSILLIVTSFNNGDLGKGFLATTGINGADRGNFIPPLLMDPNNSNTLYFGTCRLYKTTDNAQIWNAISPDVTSASHPADCSSQSGGVLSTIAVAPGNSGAIYVGSDNGDVEMTADGGTTWTSLANVLYLPPRAVTQVAVDPLNAATAYAVFSGFGSCANIAITCDGMGHVFKTTNGTAGAAATWTDISIAPFSATPLPDIPVNAIVIDPDDATHSTLYIGTDIGAFYTLDGGKNWSPLGAAGTLPNAQILSLTLHDSSRTLRAATHGRGVWDLNLGPGLNTHAFQISKLAPFTANAGAGATSLVVTGTGFTGTSKVFWNGSLRSTSFTDSTHLTATNISAADLAAGGVVQVSVKDGVNTTNSLPFTVLGGPPALTSILPTQVSVNAGATIITLTGTGFSATSTVAFNGSTAGVTVTDTTGVPTKLKASLAASLLGPYGSTNDITVVNPPPGGGASSAATFTVAAQRPPNDNFANAINIASNSFTDTQDSSGATTENADATPPCVQQFTSAQGNTGGLHNGVYNTIWYKFTPGSAGNLNIDTIGSSYDSVLSVWTGSSGSLNAVGNGCNDDINPGIVVQSQITNLPLTGGTTYFIMVSSFGPPDPNPVALGGQSVFNFQFTPSPDFTLMPQAPTSATVNAGSPASYTIAVGAVNGFSSNVTLTCSLPAAATTCSVTPSPIVPGNNPTVTVTTTVRSFFPPSGVQRRVSPWPMPLLAILVSMMVLALLALSTRTRRLRLAFSVPLAALFLLLVFQAAGCGGGGGSTPPPPTGTQVGTYTVTVTGTSGTTTHTTTVSLTVK